MSAPINVRNCGICEYHQTWQDMLKFNDNRSPTTADELWVLQHHPVFTLGTAGKKHHLLKPTTIPIVQSDRGGQITYHAPGQLVIYMLLDLSRSASGIKYLVTIVEQSIIQLLAQFKILAHTIPTAPGVYVAHQKIGALGFRVRHGRTLHGLSLNIDMDMAPFSSINPCGYTGLQVTQIADFVKGPDVDNISERLVAILCAQLDYVISDN